ncbi:hypothetical protein ACR9FV_00340 [Streptococcus dysgalactiae subsp. equisimilis]|uniref:hypothetical protein n=1 Tax=Streptococcus dysgalactiae TaxID=1334 RepID=UPI0003B0054D|nr:hypothetical protein [Streptococcus dysgalactiae]BAN94353.1 hypothetical protein SDSE167_1978 [Streptococcus dysgalactiae subsp. equisimilis 167]KKC21725.1 hypothetical protein WH80_00665 [Streptococcus dysgalactiae subsp. equisimilis]OBY99083.1 hypothetical protein BBG03_09140 [Streptococcus dysgalactiae subsp. equisimilis]OBZ06639.1 hypothetical protein BBG04_08435 [Streptococcus dysgalactiae subsp. equisimilis]OCX03420.1 hypothetical protein BBG07_05150 [Streptococcus dysgalactiae subsp.
MIQIEKSKKRRFLMKSRRIKCITLLCIAVISANISLPSISVLANEQDNTTLNYSSEAVIVTDTELIINGHSYTEQELVELLETATPQPRSAIAIGGAAYYAGSYFIPGVGQVLLAATGAVVIAGATIYATHWAANTIKNFFNSEDNMTANDIISNRRKAGVRREFPGEYLNKTLKEIKKKQMQEMLERKKLKNSYKIDGLKNEKLYSKGSC